MPHHTAVLPAPPASRDLGAWSRTVGDHFPALRLTTHGPADRFTGHGVVRRSGPLVLGDLAAGTAHTVRRIPGGERLGLCKVSYQLAGRSMVTQGGHRTVLRPGDMVVYDVDLPYAVDNEAGFRSLVLMLPRTDLGLDDRPGEDSGTRLSDRDGLGLLVGPMLCRLAETEELLTGARAPRVRRVLTDLLAAAVAERRRDAHPAGPLAPVLAWLDEHLADDDLSPGRVAAEHYMSTRRLQELFRAEGTSVSCWVRGRRLQRCLADLRDPLLAGEPVATTGRRWGFADPAHFSRSFRARYGVTPGRVRSSDPAVAPDRSCTTEYPVPRSTPGPAVR